MGDLANNCGLKRIAINALYECSKECDNNKKLTGVKTECLKLSAKILKLDLESY